MNETTNITELPLKTLAFIDKQFAEWDKLNSEKDAINSQKIALLDNVETQGVDRAAFKTWAKRRKWATDKQQSFDFSLEQCRRASPAVEENEEAA
jgi:hypothetical protein